MIGDMTSIELDYIEKNPSRHGRMRYFLRIKGKRICRLPDALGSEEFLEQYWTARRKFEAAHPAPASSALTPLASLVTRPGSFKWLTLEYMRTSAFTMLDLTTQSKRRSIIESMWAEPLAEDDPRLVADMPVAKITVQSLEKLHDRKKDTPFAADERLKVLRQIFETKGKDGKAIAPNIARAVQPFRQKTDGHHTLGADEIRQYIAHHGPQSKAVLGLAIGMFTGFRVSDLAVLGPQHRRGDAFKVRLFKGRKKTPVTVNITVHPILDAILKLHPVTGFTYLVSDWGRPFSVKGLGNRISDWFTQAGLPHCTAHSIRKGLSTDQANNGATDSMLEAMFGWTDGKTSKIYTRNADRARLARQAVNLISWEGLGPELFAIDDAERTGTEQ